TMSGMCGLRVMLPLSLVMLVFCSTGLALMCYNCQSYSSEQCEQKMTCPSTQNACLKITTDGKSRFQCWEMNRCDIPSLKNEFQLNKFSSSCCQSDLCNSGRNSLPVTSLVLSLAAAILLIFSC
ncbi:Hypothetical predicted protein, partial [Pelobates cultripes]